LLLQELTDRPRILVLGGVETVPYQRLAVGADITYVPNVRKLRNADIASLDGVIMLTSQLSHTVVRRVKKAACKYNVPLHYLPTSGGTRFKCLLEEICGGSCSRKSEISLDKGILLPDNP